MRFRAPAFLTVLFLSLAFTGPRLRAEPDMRERVAAPSVAATSEPANVSDFWRAVRGGQSGTVAGPNAQSGLLITDWPKDCVEAGNCTERAVGFTLPIHDLMPAIREPEGQGAEWQTVAFVIVLFSALLVAGGFFIHVLGSKR